jgi:carbonic anhydrase
MTYPWLRRRVEAGKVALHGWYFDIETGSLLAYSPRKQEFLNLVQPLDAAA